MTMSEHTTISWCDATFNPWIGCLPVSAGCANCYAEINPATLFLGVKWGKGQARHRTSESNWRKPLAWNRKPWKLTGEAAPDQGGRRPRVFCASLADWLDDEVPIEWLADLLKLIHETPNLDWLLLTKRPENWKTKVQLAGAAVKEGSAFTDWCAFWWKGMPPRNVWFGVSVEDQTRAEERIPQLLKIPARVRFLSVEPLLGPVQLTRVCGLSLNRNADHTMARADGRGIDWVIVGGESGPKARPCNLDWLRSSVGQCRAAGVPCFVKQWGSLALMRCLFACDEKRAGETCPCEQYGGHEQYLKHPKGGDPSEWPEDLRVREFPALEMTQGT